jgi:very-short-patch-repair endonuclease
LLSFSISVESDDGPAPFSLKREKGWRRGSIVVWEIAMERKRLRVRPAVVARARQLRQPQTPAEAKLWARVRNGQLDGIRFRRQHPIDRFILDFYCPRHRMVIEVDGDSHAEQAEYDAERTSWLTTRGYSILRFTNQEIHRNLDRVLAAIRNECAKRSNDR